MIGHSVQPGVPQVQPVTARQEHRFPHLGLETATDPSAYRPILTLGLKLLQLHLDLTVSRLSSLYSKWRVSFT
jgi:hypothetical protein